MTIEQDAEFVAAFGIAAQKLFTLCDTEIDIALISVFELAPADLKDAVLERLHLIGVFPAPDGYQEDGTPANRLESIARRLSIPLDEAHRMLKRINYIRELMGLQPCLMDRIHPTH